MKSFRVYDNQECMFVKSRLGEIVEINWDACGLCFPDISCDLENRYVIIEEDDNESM